MEDSSTSMASVGPQEDMEEKHKQLVTDMFQKITEYLNGELAGEGFKVHGSSRHAQGLV